MKIQLISIAAAVAFSVGAQAQNTTTRQVKNADEDRIEAEYKADKAKCDTMKDNAKDVCEKEAKGKEKVAKAELKAKTNPSAANQRKVQEAKADAAYDVAKERCDDQKGKEKDACEKQAKAEHERAKADIKRADAKNANANKTAGTGSTSRTTGK
jgi:hypothetical protein